MGMAILFRDFTNVNLFYQAMIELAKAPGDEMIISSGYFKPDVIDNEFKSSLTKGFRDPKNAKITVIGGAWKDHNISANNCSQKKNVKFDEYCWECGFEDFWRKLERAIKPIKLEYTNIPFELGEKWHGKITLKLKKDSNNLGVIGAIIGSSNMTPSAFYPDAKYWNSECDIFLWDDTVFTPSIIKKYTKPNKQGLKIGLPLAIEVNPLHFEAQDLLNNLYEEIKNETTIWNLE